MTETDITRPTVLLTGPTRGIGAGMLRALVAHPARPRLVLLSRDRAALDRAVADTVAAGLDARGIAIDLADLDSVARAADELAALIARGELPRPDVALLNAGRQYFDRRTTSAQGYEATYAVNVLAQHLLLRRLEPLLAPGAHVVLMGSSTHRGRWQSFGLIPSPSVRPIAELEQPERGPHGATRDAGGRAYADSKLALVTVAHAWARRLAASGRRCNTYDPGLVPGTGLAREYPGYMRWTWEHVMPVMSLLPKASTATRSGRRAVELALGDRHAGLHDGYVEIGRVTAAGRRTFDTARQEELWTALERAVAPYLAAQRVEG